MAHSVGEVVEVLDASSGWLPASVLRRHEDGAYDVSVNLDETIHLGDAAACLSLTVRGRPGVEDPSGARFLPGSIQNVALPPPLPAP